MPLPDGPCTCRSKFTRIGSRAQDGVCRGSQTIILKPVSVQRDQSERLQDDTSHYTTLYTFLLYEMSIASACGWPTGVTSSDTMRLLTFSAVHAVVPRRNPYVLSLAARSLGLTKLRSVSVRVAVMTHASTLDPEPRSLKIPADTAAVTSARASSR